MTDQEDGNVPAKTKKKSRAKGCLLTFVVLLGLGALIDYFDGDPPPPSPPTPEEAHDRRLRAHERAVRECMGAAGGSAYFFNEAIKDRLNDPDSFEHESTDIVDLEAYREAVRVAQDRSDPDHKDHQWYAGREIRSLPISPGDYDGGGRFFVVTRFRARNAFGGMVRSGARGALDDDCEVHTIISIQ